MGRQPEEADERGVDDAPVSRDHDELARVGLGDQLVEGVLGPIEELEPALAARRKGPLGVLAGQAAAVAPVALGPAQPVRLAGVALAERCSSPRRAPRPAAGSRISAVSTARRSTLE